MSLSTPAEALPTLVGRERSWRNAPTRAAGLVVLLGVLLVVMFFSITMGARSITLETITSAFAAFDPASTEHVVIRDLRVPRTLLGLLVGAALGLAGTLMQGVTRNALADPGILGVNAGASLFVVIGIAAFGLSSPTSYSWLAMAGALVATLVVYAVATVGRDGANPVKLALAGAAVTAALYSVNTGILLVSSRTLQEFRFWQVGSLAGRHLDVLLQVLPFLAVGIAVALVTGRALNGLSLGDDVARALGQRVVASRIVAGIAIVILCGAATAAAGPIAFVGLVIPHIARAIVGPDYRWILAYSTLIGALLLVGADLLGRVIGAPGELQVGVVTAALGAPVFIALIRKRKLAAL